MVRVIKSYDAVLDDRKRFIVRDSRFKHYHVDEYADGTLVLRPRILVDPNADDTPEATSLEDVLSLLGSIEPLDDESLRAFQEAEADCERISKDDWDLSL